MNNRQAIIIQQFGLESIADAIVTGKAIANFNNPNPNDKKPVIPPVGQQDSPIGLSSLGTPVWDTLIFKGDTYDDPVFGKQSYPDLTIDTCLITLTQAHNVILTDINNRNGEVVEYRGKKSFRINIKGGFYSTNNNRPISEISWLRTMLGSNQTIVIKQCNFLIKEWNIYNVAVLDKYIPQTEGGYNYQLFEINFIEDLPVLLASAAINNNFPQQ